ncbi:MAG: hypothetical protein JWP81_2695 [Ferruginibacter sp.]|nr:hypothetical protein [Ferruginibacter sp.]
MENNEPILFHPIIPGEAIAGDWYNKKVPVNIVVGENSVIDSSACFKHFFSTLPVALQIGADVTLCRASIATEKNGFVKIGNHCYISGASIIAAEKIIIGDRVFIAGGVSIIDSDFHPIAPAARLADTIAISPIGNHAHRPVVKALPVTIEDDVWIGYNATILKGVTIGAGAIISPGALVTGNVPAGVTVAGNPAKPINPIP